MKSPSPKFEDLILYEDQDYILVNKPPFLATLADRQDEVNLLMLAREYVADAQVCHRLDKETSGVLAIARNPDAYRHLSILLEKRAVSKVYHALVDGIHQFENQFVDVPLLKQGDGTVRPSRQGKEAQTYIRTLATYKFHSLVACKPVTGRTHQIRVHLSLLGAPIAGDQQYGGKPIFLSQIKRNYHLKKGTEERPLLQRTALHAVSLEFDGVDGKRVFVEAPYQKDMQAALRQLELNR